MNIGSLVRLVISLLGSEALLDVAGRRRRPPRDPKRPPKQPRQAREPRHPRDPK
jgi:hypothetical protein